MTASATPENYTTLTDVTPRDCHRHVASIPMGAQIASLRAAPTYVRVNGPAGRYKRCGALAAPPRTADSPRPASFDKRSILWICTKTQSRWRFVEAGKRGSCASKAGGEGWRGHGWRLRFCYEAGPCGYSIQRQLSEAGD
jgi:hypothetical protein